MTWQAHLALVVMVFLVWAAFVGTLRWYYTLISGKEQKSYLVTVMVFLLIGVNCEVALLNEVRRKKVESTVPCPQVTIKPSDLCRDDEAVLYNARLDIYHCLPKRQD